MTKLAVTEDSPVELRGITRHRWVTMIFSELGEEICAALQDPKVLGVAINPDGAVWLNKVGAEGMQCIPGLHLTPERVSKIIHAIARYLGKVVSDESPILEGELPNDGSRVNGMLPPVVRNPTLNIRKKASAVFTLDEYVNDGILTARQKALIEEAIVQRKNIIIAGGTGSGKTTFLNACLDAVRRLTPWHRLVIIEDTLEIQCSCNNVMRMVTSANVDMERLLRAALREDPDRICVGECRGAEMQTTIDAWNTGHRGGFGTVHSDSAAETCARIEEMIAKRWNPVPQAIGRAVNLIVYLEKDHRAPKGRRVKDIVQVVGYTRDGGYQLNYVE